MAKNKLRRFEEMKNMTHVFEPSIDEIQRNNSELKKNWFQLFNNNNPIVLELGCGKGEYTIALAKKYPTKNFIGVDIKGARMWVGAKQAVESQLTNVAFLRTKVDFIDAFFEKNQIEEIWLTFSDPQPDKPNKRLTSPFFISKYRSILKPRGIIHLKTDSDLLFESTLNEIEIHKYKELLRSSNVYLDNSKLPKDLKEILHVQTHYEKLFSAKGHTNKYCQFSID